MPRQDILDDFEFDESQFDPEDGQGEVIGKYYSSLEAELSAARLRVEGIPCFLANTASQSVLASSSMAMVRLHVRPQDVERAREILRDEMPGPEPGQPKSSVFTGVLIIVGIFLSLRAIILLIQLLWGER
jgi:hypothetical protein